jgi:hypothetical protein
MAVFLICCCASGQSSPRIPTPNYDETGRKLPPGVPKYVDTNGVLTSINHRFTTPAYQSEALAQLIKEANRVAKTLKLSEQLPITHSNIVEFHISPFGFAYAFKMIGEVTTMNYSYYVTCDNKFSDLCVANYDDTCFKLKTKLLPSKQMDTNSAYLLATQWLTAASVDVKALSRYCQVEVTVNEFWNENLGKASASKFVPIYDIDWMAPDDRVNGGDTAHVEVFLPQKKLLQLDVRDSKYLRAKPIEFTNLASLFPGIAPIHTNRPVKPIIITEPLWGNSTN